ncbi:hypothetical protein EVAR_64292_1 [Eumeta japonica]|uniref:Uncharacterized protein n=1 Tax=Eumeta variegata TaxID=151549 RepID=A0A4C1SDQ8_EUMVA|nr:hypothetical protein EVAR_64292_1 [Eumeta japonica]
MQRYAISPIRYRYLKINIADTDSDTDTLTEVELNQAAILALNSYTTTSSLVEECKQELSRLSCLSVITLVWVPAHRDYYGNERADELARRGTALDISSVESVGIPLGSIKSGILRHFLRKSEERWRRLDTCRVARFLWPSYNEKRTMQLVALSRTDISRLLAVMTGHWLIGVHAGRLGLPFNHYCRSCKDRGKEETVFHLLCECPALAVRRRTFLGRHMFSDLGELSESRIGDLLKYLTATGWI